MSFNILISKTFFNLSFFRVANAPFSGRTVLHSKSMFFLLSLVFPCCSFYEDLVIVNNRTWYCCFNVLLDKIKAGNCLLVPQPIFAMLLVQETQPSGNHGMRPCHSSFSVGSPSTSYPFSVI